MYERGLGAEYDYDAAVAPVAPTPIWRQIVTALPSIVQSGAQIATAFRTNAPVGVTPQYGLPVYQPQQPRQQSFLSSIDPMTLGLIAGGTLLVVVLMTRR